MFYILYRKKVLFYFLDFIRNCQILQFVIHNFLCPEILIWLDKGNNVRNFLTCEKMYSRMWFNTNQGSKDLSHTYRTMSPENNEPDFLVDHRAPCSSYLMLLETPCNLRGALFRESGLTIPTDTLTYLQFQRPGSECPENWQQECKWSFTLKELTSKRLIANSCS